MLRSVSATSPGVTRGLNEDRVYTDRYEGVFLALDGMGGEGLGDYASDLAIAAITKFIVDTRAGQSGPLPFEPDPRLPAEGNRLAMALRVANAQLWQLKAQEPRFGPAATAIAALLVADEVSAICAHLGDCRIYRVREDKIERLTQDHTRAQDMLDAGMLDRAGCDRMTPESPPNRALGAAPDAFPTMRLEGMREGDVFLLCTDGLTDVISERKILEVVVDNYGADRRERKLESIANSLVTLANKRGGDDNVGVVIVERT